MIVFVALGILWTIVFVRLLAPAFAALLGSRVNAWLYLGTMVLEPVALVQLLVDVKSLPLDLFLFVIAMIFWIGDFTITAAYRHHYDAGPSVATVALTLCSLIIALLGTVLFVDQLLIWQSLACAIPYPG